MGFPKGAAALVFGEPTGNAASETGHKPLTEKQSETVKKMTES